MSTALITGAARGIGLELARAFAIRGWTVLATCRRASEQLGAVGVRVIEGVDVCDNGVGEYLVAALHGTSIDLVIHNAGVLFPDTLDDLDMNLLCQQFEVHALGPLRVTRALLDHLTTAAKVVVLSSEMGSIGQLESGGDYGYRMSKAAANMAVACLAHDLGHRGIAVMALHPGYVSTGMTGFLGEVSAAQAANRIVPLIEGLSLATSGQFINTDGVRLPW